MQFQRSKELFQEAQNHLVGGVNSPVRAFKSVGGNPLFISHGKGSKIYDVDQNEYIDCVGSYGPLILGHTHPVVTKGMAEALQKGSSFGATTEAEIELAQLVKEAFPSIELLRFVNSGTEAILSAVRLARGYTRRNKIIKFNGCYHGHCDALLTQAGSGLMTYGLADSAGVPESTVKDTIVVQYNSIEGVEEAFKKCPDEIAAVLIEPVAGNMGVVLPQNDFLSNLRKITEKHGTLLVFDEVMTGFRPCFGGAQTVYNIKPDITCLGKVIGGGLPVGAYGAKKEIMEMVSPLGPVYQAGTLSGNPLAMTAGILTLKELKKAGLYDSLIKRTEQLEKGLKKVSETNNLNLVVNRFGSMISPFFTRLNAVTDNDSVQTCDTAIFTQFFNVLLQNGVFIPPSQFEAWFISSVHTENDIEHIIKTAEKAIQTIQGN